MGHIYKITNKENNKIYIGQTVKNVEKRFQQHRNNYNKPYFSQLALYQAFKKYGLENFSFEEIEEVPNEELDEREKYWIQYFNSYQNGYNSTLGGRLVELYNWDLEEIIALYKQHRSARKVAEIMGCDHSTIDNLLNANQVERYTPAQVFGRTIYLRKDNQEYEFDCANSAAQWLIDNNFVKSKNIRCVRNYLTNGYLKKKPYYGFEIDYESKRQSAPLVTED